MIEIVRNDPTAAFILGRRLGITLAAPFWGWVLVSGDEIVGAFVFNNYSGSNLELSLAISGPVGIGVARSIARLAFVEFSARRITVHTKTENSAAIHAAQAIGFRSEGTARHYFEDADAARFALFRDEQKLIRVEPNEQFRS